MTDTLPLLQRYAQIARPIIREHFRADSCIAATAITIGVLNVFDIKAVPFPCDVTIFNRAFIARIEKAGRLPITAEETLEWTSDNEAWSVGVGIPTSPDQKVVGHLVAIAADKYLVDASFDQASRPKKNLIVPPVLVEEIPRTFRRNQTSFTCISSTGMMAVFRPRPKNKMWLISPNWTERNSGYGIPELVSEIASRL